MINYLRGDRTLEGSTYRTRGHVLGDIVSAEPVFVAGANATYADTGYNAFAASVAARQKAIYQGANDGMLHVFNASTGDEMWAYVPYVAYPRLNALTDPLYSHQFTVDGTPTVGDVDFNRTASLSGGPDWQTILVGGLAAGGPGFYALRITDPILTDESAAPTKLMWEFPNLSTPTAVKSNVGYSFGKPVIAKTRAKGWVVLVTSGYNNGDGQGHLFVLDARYGSLINILPRGSPPTLPLGWRKSPRGQTTPPWTRRSTSSTAGICRGICGAST